MTVNLSTRSFYDRSGAAMSSLTARAEALNTQVATGKRLLAPSDDAAGYARLQRLARAGTDAGAYAANAKLAGSALAQADTTLGQIGDQLTLARELAVQAGNGTLSTDAKKAIATQLRGVAATVASLGNTVDARGAPLFGGAGTGAALTVGAGGAFALASGKGTAVPIGDGQEVELGVAAADVLALKGGRDLGTILAGMADALDAGGTLAAADTADLAGIAAQNTAAQAAVGARAVRVELQTNYLKEAETDREAARSDIEDADVTATYMELQKTMTILSATQASFGKLSQLSLFTYLR